jgi:DsbC/DsbD-like thiol-disulfide interchange protein
LQGLRRLVRWFMLPVSQRCAAVSALLVLLAAAGAESALAQVSSVRHVKASLVGETDAVRPGQPLTVGIRLEMEKGWHTYWRNPGDAGLPTRVKWELPEGMTAGEIRWPYPARFSSGPVLSYGYEHEVLLLVEMRVPPSLGPAEVRLSGRVDWLECQQACLPGKADVALTLPVRSAASPGPHAALFGETRRRVPAKDPAWRVSLLPPVQGLSLVVRPPKGREVRAAYFYPVTLRLVDYARPQELERDGDAYRLVLGRDPNSAPSGRLAGVLVAETGNGTVALEVDVPVASGPARTSIKQERKP